MGGKTKLELITLNPMMDKTCSNTTSIKVGVFVSCVVAFGDLKRLLKLLEQNYVKLIVITSLITAWN